MNESKSGKDAGKPGRTDRLAEALRANLHRRKAQARARGKGAAISGKTPENGPETATDTGEDR